MLEQEFVLPQQVRREFLLRRRLKFGDKVLEEGKQQMYLSHPILTDKSKCDLYVPRKFNTHKDVIGEVTKAILQLIIVHFLQKKTSPK